MRYVGKTKYTLSVRLAQHMTPKELSLKHRRAKWLRCLKAQGLKPEARIIEVTTAEEWEVRERHWEFHFNDGFAVKEISSAVRINCELPSAEKQTSKSLLQIAVRLSNKRE